MKGKPVIKSQQSKPKTGMKVSFNDKGLKRPNKPFSSGPAPTKFGAGKQKGPAPSPKVSGFKGGPGKLSAKPSKKQQDEDDEDEFDDEEEGDFEDLDEDDFDDEDEDDEDEDDDMGEGDGLDDEDADDMDEAEDKEEPVSKKGKAVNAKGKAVPAAQAQTAKPNKQPQAKPLRQAQKANQKAETPAQKQPQKAGEKSKGAAPTATAKAAAKKPAVPAAFAPGRGAGANLSESSKAEAQFWEAVAKMPPLTPEQAKRVDDLLSSEGKRILFVKNIPEEVSASQVKALSPDILTVRIPMSSSRKSKKNKKKAKFAFVEFANEALAQKNIAVIGRASFGEGHTLHASVARGDDSDKRSMRASEWKVGVFFVGGINPSAPGGGGDPAGSETALTARQAATEKAIRALVPNADQVLVPINTTSLQIRGFAFVLFNDAQKAITAFEEIKKKALTQPPMLFGSKVFFSLARDKHHEKQPKTKPTQPQDAKTPATPNAAAKAPTNPQTPQQPEQAAASAPAANADESFAKRPRLTSGGSVASTGSASAQKKLLGSPAQAPAPAAVSKPASPAAAKAQAATPQGKQQQQQQTSAKKEQAPPAKKQELAKGKGAPAAAGKADKQGAQKTAAAAKGKKEQPGLKKAGAKRPLDEEDDDDDDDDFIDEDEEGDDDEDDEGDDD
jgi:RNA recognition motif-containing protein